MGLLVEAFVPEGGHPAFNLNEIANVVRAAFGRKPDVREARAAAVALRLDGWSVKAIAGYLGVHHATVYRALEANTALEWHLGVDPCEILYAYCGELPFYEVE